MIKNLLLKEFIYTELCFSISSLWEWHKALTHVTVNTVTYKIWYQYHVMIQNPVKHLRWKVFNYFCKALHLRCLTKFCIQLCEDGSVCRDVKNVLNDAQTIFLVKLKNTMTKRIDYAVLMSEHHSSIFLFLHNTKSFAIASLFFLLLFRASIQTD